jgi:hypothetical protein
MGNINALSMKPKIKLNLPENRISETIDIYIKPPKSTYIACLHDIPRILFRSASVLKGILVLK